MSWAKYKLALLFFSAAVASGVFVILTGFNHMIYPVGPVNAFNLQGEGPGVYEVEFLGEKTVVKIPVETFTGFSPGEMIENAGRHIQKIFDYLNQKSSLILEDVLSRLKNEAGKVALDLDFYVCKIKKWLSDQDRPGYLREFMESP